MLELRLHNRTLRTKLRAFVMGIVNTTPDSFWKGSRGGFEMAMRLIEEGADIIDIGGESSRPGAKYICEEEEIQRVVPVVKEIRKHSDCPISIDTRKLAVMEAAYNEGADIVNDISSFEDDKRLGLFTAKKNITAILMHKRGIPCNMQQNTFYADVFSEVDSYLERRALYAEEMGILPDKIILDPGIGFGKDRADNCKLIKRCGEICRGKYRVMIGLSRKTCVGDMTGRNAEDRLAGSIAAEIIAVISGASIIRVHDVSAALDALKVLACLS